MGWVAFGSFEWLTCGLFRGANKQVRNFFFHFCLLFVVNATNSLSMPTWDVQHAHIGGFFSFGTKISRKLRRLTIDDDNLIILSSKKTTNVSKHVSTAQNLQFVEEPGVLVVSTSYCLHVCGFGTGARRLYFSSQESLTSFTDAIMSLKASSNTRLQEQDIQDDVFIVQLLGVTGLKSSDDPYLKGE